MVVRAAYTSLEIPSVDDWNSYVLNGALQYIAEYNVTSLVSAIGMDYAFSYPKEQFRNFRVVLGDLSSDVASVVLIQMQTATTPVGPALHNYAARHIDTAGAVTFNVGVNGTAFVLGAIGTSATLKSYYVFDICTPQSGFATTIQGRGGTLGVNQTNFSGQLNNTTAYDGLSITAFGTTIQGTCQVYGYRTEL